MHHDARPSRRWSVSEVVRFRRQGPGIRNLPVIRQLHTRAWVATILKTVRLVPARWPSDQQRVSTLTVETSARLQHLDYSRLDRASDLQSRRKPFGKFPDVRDDTHHPVTAVEGVQGADDRVESLGVESAEAFVQEQ